MSEDELENLKEQIKKELLNELTSKKLVRDNAWKNVKQDFEKMFYSKGYTGREQYQIFTAISVIVRLALGYKEVQAIPSEKAEEIRQIMYKILNILPNKTERR